LDKADWSVVRGPNAVDLVPPDIRRPRCVRDIGPKSGAPMQSTLNPKQKSPDDVVVVAPDVVRVAPGDKELAETPQSGKNRPADSQSRAGSDAPAVPPVDATFRAAAVNTATAGGQPRSFGRSAMRVVKSFVIAMVLAAGSGAIAYGWQNYGDTAKELVFEWLPQHLPTSIPSLSSLFPSSHQETSTPAEQPASQAGQAVASIAQPASDAAAPAVQSTEGATPPPAALPAESTQLLQSMAHDLASLGQEIVQLKTSIEQLKASQEQMSRELAKARDQNARPRLAVATPPMRPASPPQMLPLRRPPSNPPTASVAPPLSRAAPQTVGAVPPLRSAVPPQAAGAPPPMPYAAAPPVSLQPDPPAGADAEDGGPVVRPPMPVR
jgi:hypothetical protein